MFDPLGKIKIINFSKLQPLQPEENLTIKIVDRIQIICDNLIQIKQTKVVKSNIADELIKQLNNAYVFYDKENPKDTDGFLDMCNSYAKTAQNELIFGYLGLIFEKDGPIYQIHTLKTEYSTPQIISKITQKFFSVLDQNTLVHSNLLELFGQFIDNLLQKK